MLRTPPVHYLRPNERDYSPHRILVFDCETVETDGVQVLRLWRAMHVYRHGRAGKHPEVETFGGSDAAGLADLLAGQAQRGDSLWCYAHNTAFDLTVTRLPVLLSDRGWEMTQHSLTGGAPWARFARGKGHLVLADSASILPASVREIGALVGIAKPDLPRADDSPEAWGARCEADVEIVATALCQVLDWWDRSEAGSWTLTGPGNGWNHMRHRHQFAPIVIDPDPDARAFERRAITGGRREVWRVGALPDGSYADIDFAHAHASVCAALPLPFRRLAPFDSLPLDSNKLTRQTVSVLAEVTVRTAEPRYPLQTPGGVLFPTGTFRTVLAGPEIEDAARRGALLEIGHGYTYRVMPHMCRWGQWITAALDDETGEVPPVCQLMFKGWSRTVPGRWALRTGQVVLERPHPQGGWSMTQGFINPGRIPATTMVMGGREWVIAQDLDGDNAFPAILAWVQSWTRLLLGRLVDALGDAVLQCNTDGALVDAQRLLAQAHAEGWEPGRDPVAAALARLAPDIAPLRARVKRAAERVEVIGPQHIILDPGDGRNEERRLSGVPRRAKEVGPRRYAFEVWPRLSTQVQEGDPRGYVVRETEVSLAAVPVARWVLEDGTCLPPEAEIGVDGQTRILPPRPDLYQPGGLDLDAPVHPALAGLVAEGWEIAAALAAEREVAAG